MTKPKLVPALDDSISDEIISSQDAIEGTINLHNATYWLKVNQV